MKGGSTHFKSQMDRLILEKIDVYMFCFAHNNHNSLRRVRKYYKIVEENHKTRDIKDKSLKFLMGCMTDNSRPPFHDDKYEQAEEEREAQEEADQDKTGLADIIKGQEENLNEDGKEEEDLAAEKDSKKSEDDRVPRCVSRSDIDKLISFTDHTKNSIQFDVDDLSCSTLYAAKDYNVHKTITSALERYFKILEKKKQQSKNKNSRLLEFRN